MAENDRPRVTYTGFTVPWLTIFILIKLFGTGLATWTWWWVLCSPVPVLWLILDKLGMLK